MSTDSFLQQIINFPPEHHEQLAAFAEDYPETGDLLFTNPPLAVALANAGQWDTFGLVRGEQHYIGRLLQRRRRRICGALGFPSSERVVKILGKVKPRACRMHLLAGIRCSLRNPTILSIFSHLPTIGEAELKIAAALSDCPPISANLFADLAEHCMDEDWSRLLRQTEIVLQHAPCESGRFQSVKMVRHRYYRMWRELAEAQNLNPLNTNSAIPELVFPPAPLPGIEDIQPIKTTSALLEEARDMNHCVFSYLDRVAEGDAYLYRVMNPERATLLIGYRGTAWHMEEIAGIANRKISSETESRVESWLCSCQTS